MTNTQLEAFLTLCRYGNITQAAEHLFITQPALSRLIKSLESELGYTLFNRGKGQRQAVLTEEGQRFRAIAVDMDRLYRQAKSHETAKVRTMLRVAATPALYSSFLPDAYIRFRKARSDVDVELDAVHSMEAYRQLVRGAGRPGACKFSYCRTVRCQCALVQRAGRSACSKGLYPEGVIHPSQLDRSLSISTGWVPDFQAWFEYWFGKTYPPHIYGSKSEAWWSISELCRISGSSLESSAEHIQRNTGADVHLLADAPPDRVCYALYMHQKKAAPEMVCCQLYARACRRCLKSSSFNVPHSHFIARIHKIVNADFWLRI